jgi:hypothetical protein
MVFRFGEARCTAAIGFVLQIRTDEARDDPKVIQPIVVVTTAAAVDVALNTCHLNRIDLI